MENLFSFLIRDHLRLSAANFSWISTNLDRFAAEQLPPFLETKIEQSRHDIKHRHRSQQRSGQKARQMRVLPDPKEAERKINCQRYGGHKQPTPRRRVRSSQ